jgi:hypothetical protein
MEGQSNYTSIPEQKMVHLQDRKSLILVDSENIEHVFNDFRYKMDIDIYWTKLMWVRIRSKENYTKSNNVFLVTLMTVYSMKHILFSEMRKMIAVHCFTVL